MTDILAPVERTNWMLSIRNSEDRNDVPSAWLDGLDNSGPCVFTWEALASSLFTPTPLPTPPRLPPTHPLVTLA